MDDKHREALRDALNQLLFRKFAKFTKAELKHWTQYELLREGAWRAIAKHLPEGVTVDAVSVVEIDQDILVFFTKSVSPLSRKV